MKKVILSIIPILLISFLIGCTEENELETVDEIVITAYLHANDTLTNLKIEKIIPLGVDNFGTAVNDASVQIFHNGINYPFISTGGNGSYENLDLIFDPDQTYQLEVSLDNKLITAETFIPTKPVGLTLSGNRH